MTERHAILVRLLDGEQRRAIEKLARPGESLSAALRRVLLAAANRMELDRPVAPHAERARQGGDARGRCTSCGRRRPLELGRICGTCMAGL